MPDFVPPGSPCSGLGVLPPPPIPRFQGSDDVVEVTKLMRSIPTLVSPQEPCALSLSSVSAPPQTVPLEIQRSGPFSSLSSPDHCYFPGTVPCLLFPRLSLLTLTVLVTEISKISGGVEKKAQKGTSERDASLRKFSSDATGDERNHPENPPPSGKSLGTVVFALGARGCCLLFPGRAGGSPRAGLCPRGQFQFAQQTQQRTDPAVHVLGTGRERSPDCSESPHPCSQSFQAPTARLQGSAARGCPAFETAFDACCCGCHC